MDEMIGYFQQFFMDQDVYRSDAIDFIKKCIPNLISKDQNEVVMWTVSYVEVEEAS